VAHACNPSYRIRRIVVQSQLEILSQEKPSQKRVGGVAQGVGPEFKSQYCKKRKKNLNA
jgi:hypothetical protein